MSTSQLKIYKEISSIPTPYQPNAMYFIRVGDGVDIYISNSTGTGIYIDNKYRNQDANFINASNLIGSDTLGTGSVNSPFVTIAKAMSVVNAPGVMKLSGSFSEDIACGNSMANLVADFGGATVIGQIRHTGSCDSMIYKSGTISTGNVWHTQGTGIFTNGQSATLTLTAGAYNGGNQGRPTIGDTIYYSNAGTWIVLGKVTAIQYGTSATILASTTATLSSAQVVGTSNVNLHCPIAGTVAAGLFVPSGSTQLITPTVGSTIYLAGSGHWLITGSGSNPTVVALKQTNSTSVSGSGWMVQPLIDLPSTDGGGHVFDRLTMQTYGQVYAIRGNMAKGMTFQGCKVYAPNSIGYETGTLTSGQEHVITQCDGMAINISGLHRWTVDAWSSVEIIGSSSLSCKFTVPPVEVQQVLSLQTDLNVLAASPANYAEGWYVVNFSGASLPSGWTSAGTNIGSGTWIYNTQSRVYIGAQASAAIGAFVAISGSIRQSWVLRNDGSKLYRVDSLEAILDAFISVPPAQVDVNTTLINAINKLQAQKNLNTEGKRLVLNNINTSGTIGTAVATVDNYSWIEIRQTNSNITLSLPTPTDMATPRIVRVYYPTSWIVNSVTTNANNAGFYCGGALILSGQVTDFMWNGSAWSPYQANQLPVGSQASSNSLAKVISSMDVGTALASLQNQLLIAANPAMCYWDGKADPSITGNSFPQASLSGNATWVGGSNVLRLTENVNSQFGTIVWDFPHVPFLHARFHYKSGGGNGADAMYFFCFCDAIPTDERGSGTTKGYTVAISEYHGAIAAFWGPNGGWSGGGGTSGIVGDGALATSSQANIADNTVQVIDVILTKNRIRVIRNATSISVESGTAGNVIDFYDVQTRDLSGTKMGFGARTGGSNNYHYLGDCLVTRSMNSAIMGLN